jgi:hypothetical protein
MILTFGCLLAFNLSFSQVLFWGTSGNTASSSNFLGTTNNEDLIIKTNGNTAVKVKANGNFILKSLEGSGNGLVLFDNNGKLNPLVFSGDANQVLRGDGTFGTVGVWQTGSGGKIYYNGGKVGIGTTSPNFKLDVDGDVRITQNLYLQGALVISDKIETPKQMKAKTIQADSILMDSTRAFYGESNFKGDVKITSKLNVNGDAFVNGSETVSGNLISGGNLYFAGGQTIKYNPASGGVSSSITMGLDGPGPGPDPALPCLNPVASTFNFTGLFKSLSSPGFPSAKMLMGMEGGNGLIDVDAVPTGSAPPKLLLNYYCGKDVEICTGANGGNISLSSGPNGGNVNICSGTTGNVILANSVGTRVGIATSNPLAKFDVQNNDPSLMTMTVSKVEAGGGQIRRIIMEPKLNFGDYNALTQVNDAGFFWTDGAGGALRNQDAGFVIGPWPGSAPGAVEYFGMRITNRGAVGVGIPNPEAAMHIQNDVPLRGEAGLKVTSNEPMFEDQQTVIGIKSEGTSDLNKVISCGKKSGTTYAENFVVYADGHAFARDIKVTLDGIDHQDVVFEKNYNLWSLAKVENYISENGHLPNIPSTKEVEEAKGISLGKMSELQLNKIEELTLYIIELNKKVSDLQNKVQEQDKELELLKK